ncbi:MAG: hypothetical protein LBL50_01555, partial [Candidatus Margulisbacteria bacterium]|nr:hypothetical protein [Candidatus Margulisiibacteriota bacterium]
MAWRLELTINSGTDKRFILPIRNDTVNDLYISWGDGSTENYKDSPNNYAGVPHEYSASAIYTIRIGGSTYFAGPYNAENGGALGFGFSQSSDGYNSYYYNKSRLLAISGNLVALLGNYIPTSNNYMFSYTFSGCSGLTGSIPASLFSGISGAPVQCMFAGTFSGCSGLTGIPANLFSGINGALAADMFASTFSGCSGLTGIPANLFSG